MGESARFLSDQTLQMSLISTLSLIHKLVISEINECVES